MKQEIYKLTQNFSKNIKIERKSHKMTQKQVAQAIGIKTQSYQAYEKNISIPGIGVIPNKRQKEWCKNLIFQIWVSTCPACKDSEWVKTRTVLRAEFAKCIYTCPAC